MSKDFDLEQTIKALQSGQDQTGKDGLLTPLIKQITEAALKKASKILCQQRSS